MLIHETLSPAPTLLMTLGNGCDGEVIGFNRDDDLLYHYSGYTPSCRPILETIDPSTLTITDIAMSGATHGEMCSFAYFGAGFIAGNIDDNFYTVSTTGVVTYVSGPAINGDQRGIVLVEDGIGTEVCTANPKSTGSVAHISGWGSDTAGPGYFLNLASEPVPGQPGIFFYGASLIDVPFGNGRLCATNGIVRSPLVIAAGNRATYSLENSAFIVGQTVYFQHWYRDPADGGAFFNTSFALDVMFH